MTGTTTIYHQDPDPLSVLLTRLELRAEVYVNGNFCGTWAVDTSGSRRIPFHLIGEGQAWLHFADEPPRMLATQDLVVFPHDTTHVVSHSPEPPTPDIINADMTNDGAVTQMICGFFEFRNPAVFPVLDALSSVVFLRAAAEDERPRSRQLIDMMLEELVDARPGSYAAIDQTAFLLFIEVIRSQVESGLLSGGLISALFDARIGRALSAIHERPDLSWSLESLAERATMSRSGFAERFASLVGQTPMKYLALWRMTEARRLLVTTALSTAQVAQKSGYESEAAFRKAFKQLLGETPGSVRSAAQELA